MSRHLDPGWAAADLSSASGSGQLEQITEGPLKQIEAARKALHSPSLVSSSRYTLSLTLVSVTGLCKQQRTMNDLISCEAC